MFKEIGQLAGLMRNMGKVREEAERFHAKLGEIHAEGTAGGDMVTAKVNGRMEVLGVKISEAAWALQDREMLEDLIAAATNQALVKAREAVNQEAQSMASNLGLPPGMGLPGLT
jgi:DNA-binding YbaB/EbfC family protein